MSAAESFEILKTLVDQRCRRTLAADALKLRFPGNAYVWIYPPWRLGRNGEILMWSEDCPEDREAFVEWSKGLDPLNDTVLREVGLGDDDLPLLIFEGGYVLVVLPWEPDPEDDPDEEQWYAVGPRATKGS